MTSLTDFQPYYEVQVRVDEVRGRMRAIRMAEGLLAFVTIACAAVLVTTLVQGFLRFGPAGRLALLVLGGAAVLAAFWRYVLSPLRHEPTEKETARLIETRLPQLGNNLINTLLLTEHADEWSGPLVARAIREAAAGARGIDLKQAVRADRAKRWALAAALAAALLGAFVLAAYPRFTSAGLQILSPFDPNIASVGSVRFTVQPGHAEVMKGQPLDIAALIDRPNGKTYDGVIEIIETAAGQRARHGLIRAPQRLDLYTYRVPQVLQPFTYRLTIGGTESERFRVTLREPAMVQQIDLRYVYPEYTGLEPQVVANSGGEVRCLVGTQVQMTLHLSAAADAANLFFGRGRLVKCVPSEDRRRFAASFTVLESDTYQVRLEGPGPGGTPIWHRVVAEPDPPPTIAFTMPRGDVVAGLGETVKMGLKAADRYGLGQVALLAQSDADEKPAVVRTWSGFKDPREAVLDHVFTVDAAKYRLGQVITCWAVAADQRTYQGGSTPAEPNRTETPRLKILVQDRKKAQEERLAHLTRLYDRLREILKAQESARIATSALGQTKSLPEAQAAGSALAQAQGGIREATLAVTREVTFDDITMPIRQTLLVLAANEMAAAVTKARAVADLKDGPRLGDLGPLAAALAADQDVVIATLRQILDITGKLTDAVREEPAPLAPSDLPPDTLAKLKALRERLKEFVEEQKRVIEASKDLAKRPVDDFTEADQRELERLKAVEDQWDKFLTEQISDFSKVPEVDASNPSLVKELIEVRADVQMAADALARKAMDVVVPLEELGMEGAEEIVENLERWLPDTPDRERWQQEEALSRSEIPHPELPEQMEDIVGDLLEQEEDLFEEIEDITSGAADSADKGAGWDAMDGPISNFSAKGVTGNRLPNTSEVGGRSGEGRTGKSSGEFIEEEAAGKGGRRTPTRLSPDAFSAGEVKDTSDEAPTGATGGGKISGAGSEGLEGPVPPDLQRRMGDLAGRQAQLRNKAEGVKAGLQVKNYESFALDEALEGMRRVQRDLLAGRYQNALRQKDVVLGNLKASKMMLGGEIQVRKDSSAALPNEVQDELLDALEKPMPRGYEEYLKQYYQRLSEGG